MSQSTTLILLSQTVYNGGGNANVYDVIGDKQQAAGYYLGNRSLQTVNISTAAVTGNVVIQASLATTPSDTDWFDIYELDCNFNYPDNTPEKTNSTTNLGVNLKGNYVWLRAKIVDFAMGTVNYIKVSY